MLLNVLEGTGQLPMARGYPAHNVSSAKIEKFWFNPEAIRSYRVILNQERERDSTLRTPTAESLVAWRKTA